MKNEIKLNRKLGGVFARRVAEERKKLGLSQEDLASKLGFSQGYVSLVESGLRADGVPLRMVEHFAHTLGIKDPLSLLR